jgi:hypothetical protein
MSVIINPSSGGGGGGMTIGGTVVGGTPGSVLFVGTGPVLAQDNANFFWDDTNFFLKLGHSGTTTASIYLNNVPAIYEVLNVSGNNWFEGNAGNATLTGNSNFGTGDQTLGSLTTGINNTAIGDGVMTFLTTGNSNFAFGTFALRNTTAGSGNVAIGPNTMQSSLNVSNNIAIGSGSVMTSLGNVASCTDNIAIGSGTFNALTGGSSGTSGNIAIGSRAGANWVNASNLGNILIGASVAQNVFGDFNSNVVIGTANLRGITGLSNSTVLGCWNGPASGTLSDIIVLTDGLSGVFGTVNAPALDWNYLTSNVWSFKRTTNPQGLHVYNSFDDAVPTTNYERAALSWIDTANTFRIESQAGGTGTIRIITIDGFSKAGAPAAGDLPSGTWALIDDTTNNQTWLVFNKAGTIRKVQLT